MDKLLRNDSVEPTPVAKPASPVAMGSPLLLEVLWRRRATVVVTIIATMALAAAYLVVAKPVYRAAANLRIEQNAPKVFSENQGSSLDSDSFLQTQQDVLTSTAVVQRALDSLNWRSMKTFANLHMDPAAWLQQSGVLGVDQVRKSDILSVSMESRYPVEAASIANAIAQAYLTEQSSEKSTIGKTMVASLQAQRDLVEKSRVDAQGKMQQYQQKNGVVALGTDKANSVTDQVTLLSSSLELARMQTFQDNAQVNAIQAALSSPDAIEGFVAAQEVNGKVPPNHDLEDLRSKLADAETRLTFMANRLGAKNQQYLDSKAIVDSYQQQITEKERAIAMAQLDSAQLTLAAAQENEEQISEALDKAKAAAMAQAPDAAEFTKLQTETDDLQKQEAALDARIAEVTLNDISAGPLNAELLDAAEVPGHPVKPVKWMIMGAAMLMGWIAGMGLALLREHRDALLRSVEEIPYLLGTPVLASVPRINTSLTSVARGQLVRLDPHSPSAEAYRSVRTALHLSAASAKTVLMASPSSGDGKSTAASNLAIAFAESGDRTLLIDCDLREPVQHLIFESDGTRGLSGVMSGETKLSDAIRPTRTDGLYLLPCGPVPGNPTDLLTSKRFAGMLKALRETFDRIIIDSPPLVQVADGRVLSAAADVTLLVLRMNKSARPLGQIAVEGLDRSGANLVGAIANDVTPRRDGRYGGYYGSSWRFASRADRLALSAVGGSIRGELADVQDVKRVSASALSVSEQDWSIDVR